MEKTRMHANTARRNLRILVALAMGLIGATARADGTGLLLGGTQWGAYGNYSYVGWLQPLSGAVLGHGWYVQGFASYLSYRYDTGYPSKTVRTTALGGNLGLGYAGSAGALSWSLSGAVGYANFDAQPSAVPGAARPTPQGAVWTFTPQVQWSYALGHHLALAGIDNYSFGQGSYWTEWRGRWRWTTKFAMGPEGILQGGPNYRIHQVGLFAQIGPFAGWQLGLAGGVSFQSGLKNSGYVGLSFSKTL